MGFIYSSEHDDFCAPKAFSSSPTARGIQSKYLHPHRLAPSHLSGCCFLSATDHSFRRNSRVLSPGEQTRLASVFLIQLIHCPSGKSALFPTEPSSWSFAIFFFLSFQQQRPSLLDAQTFFFLIQRELQRPLDSFSHLKLKSGSHFYLESLQGLSAHYHWRWCIPAQQNPDHSSL